MKKGILLLLFFNLQLLVFCQTRDIVPKIIPPSPNAASLEKFSSIPIDYSTGVPSISYPMWSWQRGKLQFSLGLSYHAGGHKVDDMASNTGLGWATSGIGRISRTVRGLPDDHPTKGFMYTDTLPFLSCYMYSGDEWYYPSALVVSEEAFLLTDGVTPRNTPFYSTADDVANNQLDGEQDVFSYSFNGSSGKFVIDKDKNIVPLENTKVKIEMVRNSMTIPLTDTSGNIKSFVITDDKGIVYKYSYLEKQYTTTYSDPGFIPGVLDQNYTTGWLLTKIIDPSTQDSIVINYAATGAGGATYETGFSENISNSISYSGISSPTVSTSYQSIDVDDISASSIIFPDSSTVSFQYSFSREDFVNTNALTRVKVKNYRDETIKWFQLKYSYFASGDGDDFPVWEISSNDYSKRLRLDSIIELSSDSNLLKPTVFTYNSTLLNARGSKNIDFWGCNVNPARNNLEYAPAIPTRSADKSWALYLPGADRTPDSTYAKAAVLEKIKYPEGGTTTFNYESNRAFSSFDYYINSLQSNTPQWNQSTFGNTYTLSMPSRVDTAVDFSFIAESDPDGTAQSNDPPTCLEEAQNEKVARFEITSTDDSVYTYVDYTYGELIGGTVHKVIGLPVGKTYQITLTYNSTESCAFLYPFKVSVTGTYYIPIQDKLAGGVRVRKITADDGVGNILTKSYEYKDTSGHSSAVLTSITNIPNYGYYKSVVLSGSTFYLNVSRGSNPTNTMNFNGAPLVYTRVIERENDSSSTERQYDPLVWISNGGEPSQYPYLPIQDFPNLSGMKTKEIIKDKYGTIKKIDSITYNKVEVFLSSVANRNMKTGMIASSPDFTAKYYVVDEYSMYRSRAELIKDTIITYENGNSLSELHRNTYDTSNYYLRTSTTINSKNEPRTESYTYSADGGSSTYTSMIAKNMLDYIVQRDVYRPDILSGDLSLTQTNYGLFQSGALPMPATMQSSLSGNTLQTDITFNDYDDKGNILQYTAKDGVITSFVWGYKKQYPVAKIIGKSYSDAISASSINLSVVDRPSSDAAMRTELNKLRTLSGCFVTTLTYKPLVGETSETDANGRTIYYIYDSYNRLNLIRDKDNNIIKKFCYNYYGQPVDCGYGTNAAWSAISSACEVDGSGNFTGSKLVTEKDMNPFSSTYGNTRTITMANEASCSCSGEGKKIISGVCESGVPVCDGNFRSGGTWHHYYHYLWSDSSTSSTYTGDGICGLEFE